ncbi:Chlorophyll a-b binding protein 1B-21, chloroplastic [Galdieria sulphuraria]|nr:Chlorophyll a-b binding protein 1B-21, chloroplastic [Galdieria sulphuraria]
MICLSHDCLTFVPSLHAFRIPGKSCDSLIKLRSSRSFVPRNLCSLRASASLPQKSKAIPFLDRPPAFDGSMVGDVGFDPLNISSYLDLRWLRESEIKHCRIAMLAVVGCSSVPTEAFWKTLVTGPMGQIVLWTSLFEMISTPAVIQMLQGSGREPGYFGFDPLGLGKKSRTLQALSIVRAENGRLAMIAIGGLIHQSFLTHMGAIQQLQQHKFFP